MYIRTDGEGEVGVRTTSNLANVNNGGISSGFLKVLQEQMEAWLIAIEDSKLTSNEIAFVSAMSVNSGEGPAGVANVAEGEAAYEGPAAFLYVSNRFNNIANVTNFVFNWLKYQNDLADKASSMFG